MPKKLLLADDSVTIQKVVGISFASEDIELMTVDNGDDALDRVQEFQPDLVLADIVMPGRNGYEVCEAIKSEPGLRHIPVLLLAGTFEAFDEERAQRVGADGHITKPFEARALVDRVNELLTQSDTPVPAVEESAYGLFDDGDPAAMPEADDLPLGEAERTFVFDASGTFGSNPLGDGPERPTVPTLDAVASPLDPGEPEEQTVIVSPRDASLGLDDLTDLGLEGTNPEQSDDLETPPELLDPLLGAETPLTGEADSSDPLAATRLELGALGPDLETDLAEELPPPQLGADRSAPLRRSEFDVSSSDLGDPLAATTPGVPPASPGGAVNAEDLRRDILERLEKVAWEAFGDLTDQLVRQTVARVEAIAWEVIPEMAENLVREEIRKLKNEE